jgi:SAM-dependent methyltransferase
MADHESPAPIDCPLHKHGAHADHQRPFEDTGEYIALLERPDRASWQKPDDVVAALNLAGTETVADIGAGSGYFTFRIAKTLPQGKVVAADTDAEMIRHIQHKAQAEGITNVEVKLIQPTDPGVPPAADIVFVCDVLHHVADQRAWLATLVAEMKPAARLVLIEYKEGPLPKGPPESMKIPHAQLLKLADEAGLAMVQDRADLLPYQHYMVFTKQLDSRRN